jgi:hypothetical protein
LNEEVIIEEVPEEEPVAEEGVKVESAQASAAGTAGKSYAEVSRTNAAAKQARKEAINNPK